VSREGACRGLHSSSSSSSSTSPPPFSHQTHLQHLHPHSTPRPSPHTPTPHLAPADTPPPPSFTCSTSTRVQVAAALRPLDRTCTCLGSGRLASNAISCGERPQGGGGEGEGGETVSWNRCVGAPLLVQKGRVELAACGCANTGRPSVATHEGHIYGIKSTHLKVLHGGLGPAPQCNYNPMYRVYSAHSLHIHI
jgi:hypothetical protein